MLHVGGEGLLHQHVLASLQGSLRKPIVGARRRGHHHRIDALVVEGRFHSPGGLDLGEAGPHVGESPGILVDHPEDLASLPIVKVANEVRAPMPGTYDRYAHHHLQPFSA